MEGRGRRRRWPPQQRPRSELKFYLPESAVGCWWRGQPDGVFCPQSGLFEAGAGEDTQVIHDAFERASVCQHNANSTRTLRSRASNVHQSSVICMWVGKIFGETICGYERERDRRGWRKEGRKEVEREKRVNKTDRVYLLARRQQFYFTDGATVHRAGGVFLIIVSEPKGQQFIP